MATEEELRLVIAAEDQYSTVTDDVTSDLEKISDAAATASDSLAEEDWTLGPVEGVDDLVERLDTLQTENEETRQGFEDLGKQMDESLQKGTDGVGGLTDSLGGLIDTLAGAATLWGLDQALEKTLEFAAAGAGLINLAQGYEAAVSRTGHSVQEMDAALENATHGIVDGEMAMEEFIRVANASGGAIGTDWVANIELALAMQATGAADAETNLRSLDQYLLTGRATALRQVGLSVRDEKEVMEEYAASIGVAADELTEAQQVQARLNELQATGVALFGDYNDEIENLSGAGIARMQNEWGNVIEYAQTEAAPVIDELAASLADSLAAGTPESRAYNEKQLRDIEGMAQGLQGVYARIVSGLGIADFDEQVTEATKRLDIASMSADDFADALARVESVSPAAAAYMSGQRASVVGAENISGSEAAMFQRLMPSHEEQAAAAQSYADQFYVYLSDAADTSEVAPLAAEALAAPIGAGGAVAGEDFATTFANADWSGVGDAAANAIIDGMTTRLARSDQRYTDALTPVIIDVVNRHFFGGAQP